MLIGSDFSGTEECDQSQRQGIACDERIIEKAEFLGLIDEIEKIFEKFKKVVDFIARLYYNLSCVTDETQTTRTQQHSLRGVAQLG